MHPNIGLCLGFLFIYAWLVGYIRSTCWKDPTSKFFQTERAHAPKYSAHRIQEAVQYADQVGAGQTGHGSQRSPPELCVGIPSVHRDGISYLKSTLGSLQHGLSAEERAGLRFVVLLAHADQKKHADYGEPWLTNMADVLPSYDDYPERMALATAIEHNKTHGTKIKFDFSVVMEECEKTGAPYNLIVEDDVVFLDGWRHRTLQALDVATTKSWSTGHTDFLYLRLFYYEGLLGWNSESWMTYLGWSLAATVSVVCVLFLTRRYVPAARLYLTRSVFLLTVLVFMPLLITLFFAAGGNCMLPLPEGVHQMTENACCSQGLVFPHSTVANELMPHFRQNRWSEVPIDSFIEEYADAAGSLRWALTPVVMQHVGGRSSHGVYRAAYGDMIGGKIWNFGFEENNPDTLATEHSRANNQTS
ncbi:uncharacterized protein F4822DRAFT_413322 [Hypoxylon trugodes]|uniref:uncharacterized protein n=1 Tax=Hypoxylon trugodes TaxID=326681 RepID=UPI002197CE64|nr:uncharacterized protein F4822DRAFT_413322 [Hypoxylon trugodes]KAI1385524.1 hypothetical protein F4822DRAFT_413322 [Hypoxylon trugodes]